MRWALLRVLQASAPPRKPGGRLALRVAAATKKPVLAPRQALSNAAVFARTSSTAAKARVTAARSLIVATHAISLASAGLPTPRAVEIEVYSLFRRHDAHSPARSRARRGGGGRYCAGTRTGSSATRAGVSSARLISSIDRPFVSKPSSRNISAACAYQKARNNKAGNSAEGTTLGLT